MHSCLNAQELCGQHPECYWHLESLPTIMACLRLNDKLLMRWSPVLSFCESNYLQNGVVLKKIAVTIYQQNLCQHQMQHH